jgi:hypothetical protein
MRRTLDAGGGAQAGESAASEEQAQADDASEKDGVEADAGGGAREPAGGGLDERQKIAEAIADAAEAALTQSERGRQEKDPLARPCIGAG